jgi:P27 family predicted phage terminase small subunit
MGKGRPRKPASVKILQGTFRKDQEIVQNEPKPEIDGVRTCPSYIEYYGKKLWNDVVDEMVQCGIVTKIDWTTLELCCNAYDQFRRCEHAMHYGFDEEGKPVKQKFTDYFSGKTSQTQGLYNAMNKASENFLKYAIQLGMTPVARNRVEMAQRKDPEISETERILNEVTSG